MGGGADVPLISTIVTFASHSIKIVSRFIQFESLTIMKFEMVWRRADVPLMIGSVWRRGCGARGRQPLHY